MSFLTTLKHATTLNDVAQLLGYKPKSLSYVVYKHPCRYKIFTIPKSSGGARTISAPCDELKLLQRRLSDGLQSAWDEINNSKGIKRAISHGFRRGVSIYTNAAQHNGRRFVFNVDIKDFFDSINFGRVCGFFERNKDFLLAREVAKVIAAIACHDQKLPQGSPCSPIISNLIGQILDVRLAQLARRNGCTYSRYADDLTFSTNLPNFPTDIAVLHGTHCWNASPTLIKIVAQCGFELNPNKTRMQYKNSRQEVTGLIVNRRVNTRPEYRRLARAMTHSLATKGRFHIKSMRHDPLGGPQPVELEGRIDQLQGMFGFIDWIDLRFKRAAGKLDSELSSIEKAYKRFLIHRDFWASSRPVILCEGKTDSVYLRGAIRHLGTAYSHLATFDAHGKMDYKIRFFNFSYTAQRILDISGGAPSIKSFITKYLSLVKNARPPFKQNPLIVLLDNDSGGKTFHKLIGQYTGRGKSVDGMEDYYHLGANLYVVLTPIESPSDTSKIEDFFERRLLETKVNGKSFNAKNRDIETATEYSKSIFAMKVVRPNISKIDFKRFKPLLERLDNVISAHHHCAPAPIQPSDC